MCGSNYLECALVAVLQQHPAGVAEDGLALLALRGIPGLAAGGCLRDGVGEHAHNAGVKQPSCHLGRQRQAVLRCAATLARVHNLHTALFLDYT